MPPKLVSNGGKGPNMVSGATIGLPRKTDLHNIELTSVLK